MLEGTPLSFTPIIMTKNKQACILLLNDIHVSKDNIPEYLANWHEALEVCVTHGVREIAFGGDMFQSRSSQTLDVLLAVHDALLEAEHSGIRVILANGNHDKVNQENLRGYCHVFDRHANVTMADAFYTVTGEEWDFALHIGAYFPEDGTFTERLDEWHATGTVDGKLNYLYIHEGINGALGQPNEKELPAKAFKGFDRVFVGHYHNRTQVKPNIEYIGSSRQMNFGEDEEKGYTLIYTDGSTEFIKNNVNVRYQVIDVDAGRVNAHLNDRLEEIRGDGRYRTKVRIHGTSAETSNINKEQLLQSGANKVEIVNEETVPTEGEAGGLFEKFDSRKIQESYRHFCEEKEIEDVELGLNYLSKIEESCGD